MSIRLNSVAALGLFYLAAALLKLWLVSGEEIVARFQPLDDLGQVMAASRGYWFGEGYDWTMYVRLPVYPLWIGAVHVTGVPLRIAMEFVFLGAALVFALTLVRAGVPRWLAPLIYLAIVFHPASFALFNYTLAETLYAPALMLALSGLMLLWVNRNNEALLRYSALVGAGLAVLWHIRPEGELVLLLLASFAAGAAFAMWREQAGRARVLRFLQLAIFLPTAIIFASSLALKSANWFKTGLFISTEMSSPGYLAAYKALLRIAPEKPARFIPVTKETRLRAYAVSPAFNELQPFIEGENFGTLETYRSIGVKDEIAAGWFYWILRQAVASAGHGSSAVEMNAFFQRVADEIEAAIDAGKLPSRTVWSQFVDPEISNYASHLPESLLKIGAVFVSTSLPAREAETDLDPSVRWAFDAATNRRAALLSGGPTSISGWAFIEGQRVARVSLVDRDDLVVASTTELSSRPDVAQGYRATGTDVGTDSLGFALKGTLQGGKHGHALAIEGSAGGRARVALDSIEPGTVKTANGDEGATTTFAIDQIVERNAGHDTARRVQHAIGSGYGTALRFLGYAGLVASIALLLQCRSIDPRRSIYIVIWILLATVVSRVLLFTLLDASSWPGNQTRYLFPAMQLYAPLLILLVYAATELSLAPSRGAQRSSRHP